MGYYFQYSGNLKEASQISEMVVEIEDICETLRWPYELFETEYPEDKFSEEEEDTVYGIQFTPPDSDPVLFTFDASGALFNPIVKQMFSEGEENGMKVITVKVNLDDEDMEPVISDDDKNIDISRVVYKISVNLETHEVATCVQIVELIRYLSEKYLTSFSFQDDSGYWQSKDSSVLTKRLKTSRHILDKIQAKLEGKSFENPEEFIKFIRLLGTYIQKKLREEEE